MFLQKSNLNFFNDKSIISKFLQNPKMNTTILISVIRRFQGALMAYSKSIFDQVRVILTSKLHIRAFSANFFEHVWGDK